MLQEPEHPPAAGRSPPHSQHRSRPRGPEEAVVGSATLQWGHGRARDLLLVRVGVWVEGPPSVFPCGSLDQSTQAWCARLSCCSAGLSRGGEADSLLSPRCPQKSCSSKHTCWERKPAETFSKWPQEKTSGDKKHLQVLSFYYTVLLSYFSI